MSDAYTIKITGVLARTGRYGQIRFAVCDPSSRRWVDASFPRDRDGCCTWLAVDDTVFSLASSLYASGRCDQGRTAQARLQLGNDACGSGMPVDDVISMWVEESTPSFPP